MSTKYKATEIDTPYFITCTIVDWIDLFSRIEYKNLLVDSLEYCQENKGLTIYGWCLMPSHLHLICSSEKQPLSDVIRDFKTHTSKALVKTLKEIPESRREWLLEKFEAVASHLKREQKYKVWQTGYHAKEIYSNSFALQKLNYIHNNPVKEGIVFRPEEYLYSSAIDYSGEQGNLKVEFIDGKLWDTVK
jgi:REP element-mobilizing transposase RayT